MTNTRSSWLPKVDSIPPTLDQKLTHAATNQRVGYKKRIQSLLERKKRSGDWTLSINEIKEQIQEHVERSLSVYEAVSNFDTVLDETQAELGAQVDKLAKEMGRE